MAANLKLPKELISGEPAVAHLTPATQKEPGTLTAFPSGQSCTYRSGNGAVEEPGLYEIDYSVSYYERRGQEQASLFVEHFTEAAPTNRQVLQGLLETVTEHGEKIYYRLEKEASSVEEMYRLATSEGFLQEVEGIGDHYSEKIAEKIRSFEETEMRLYAILKQYSIPYVRDNKRERWTRAYFRAHPDRLGRLEENPYMLLSIADLWRESVQQVSEEEDLPPVGYRLEDIDGPIIESEPRFKTHTARLRAHLSDILRSVFSEGHTVARMGDAIEAVSARGFEEVRPSLSAPSRPINRDTLLGLAKDSPGIKVVSYRTPKGSLRKGLTTPRLHSHSSSIRRAIIDFRTTGSPFPPNLRGRMIRAAKDGASFSLTEEQKTAIRNGFGSPISAVSGPAGSGKTTVTTCFLHGALMALRKRRHNDFQEGWTEETGYSVYLTAPTGTAVQRIRRGLALTHPETGEEITPDPIGEIEPEACQFQGKGDVGLGTLHSFLGYRGEGRGFDVPPPHPAIVFVDETSMSDEPAMAALSDFANRCLSYGAPVSILIAGDANQLPPVGQGFPFRDLLGGNLSALVPMTRLSKVMRQSEGSRIIEAANRVLENEPPPTFEEYRSRNLPLGDQDFGWVSPPSHPSAPEMLERYQNVLQSVGYNPSLEDIRMVIPLRNQSSVNPQALYMRQVNQRLQRRLADRRGEEIVEMDTQNPERPASGSTATFSVGDRVMHTGKNEYSPGAHEPIMRGAQGRVASISENTVHVDYPWVNGPVMYDGPEEVWQLGLSYCLTCHAAQGSEFDFELLSIPRRAGPGMIDQSWLYTAITRAKKDLRMVAPEGRVRQAVQRNQGMRRQTILTSLEN